ncbi:MAG: helix-turn-helix transcriptional regulator [Actinomycetes bacterium]
MGRRVTGGTGSEAGLVWPMHGCEPRNFVKPCLLLLLLDGPAHGYELIGRLRPFGVPDGDPGHIYRTLRSLEEASLVRSTWEPSSSGPSRRVYRLTRLGRRHLAESVPELEHVQRVIGRYLREYAAHTAGPWVREVESGEPERVAPRRVAR